MMDQQLLAKIKKKACGSKVKHKTIDDAYIHRFFLRGKKSISVYQCSFCGYFHVGHHKKPGAPNSGTR